MAVETKYKTLYKFNFERVSTLCQRDLRLGRKSLLNPKNGGEPGALGLSAPSLLGRLESTRLSNEAAGNSQFRQHQSAGVPKTLKAGSSALFFVTCHDPLLKRCPTVPKIFRLFMFHESDESCVVLLVVATNQYWTPLCTITGVLSRARSSLQQPGNEGRFTRFQILIAVPGAPLLSRLRLNLTPFVPDAVRIAALMRTRLKLRLGVNGVAESTFPPGTWGPVTDQPMLER